MTAAGANKQLLEAADRGDIDGVRRAIAAGADLEGRDEIDMTAMVLAVRSGYVEVVQELLENGAQVSRDAIITAGMSVYSSPWLLGLLQLAQLRQVKPDTGQNRAQDAALLQAAYAGKLDEARRAIDGGADVNTSDGHSNSALRYAVRWGHIKVAQTLVEAGAHVNQASPTGWTALLEAVIGGHAELASWLIGRGADVNSRIYTGASILSLARDVVYHSTDRDCAHRIIRLLEEHDAEEHPEDEDEED